MSERERERKREMERWKEGGGKAEQHLELKHAQILLWLPKDSFLKTIMAKKIKVFCKR